MAISKHLKQFGGFRIQEYTAGLTPGVAVRFPKHDIDVYSGEPPSLADALESLGDLSRLQGLVLGPWGEEMFEEGPDDFIRDLLARRGALSNLQALFIGDLTYEDCELSWIHQAELGHIPGAFPRLEWLGVRGAEGLGLAGMKSEALKGLVLQSGGLGAGVVRQVAGAALPALEHLELWLGTDDYGGDSEPEDLAPVLAGHFPALRVLGLRNAQLSDDIAEALADAPVMATIERLDLSMGTLSDEGASALLRCPHLGRLSELNIAHHYLSDASLDALRERLGDRLIGADRAARERDSGERYVQIGE